MPNWFKSGMDAALFVPSHGCESAVISFYMKRKSDATAKTEKLSAILECAFEDYTYRCLLIGFILYVDEQNVSVAR